MGTSLGLSHWFPRRHFAGEAKDVNPYANFYAGPAAASKNFPTIVTLLRASAET